MVVLIAIMREGATAARMRQLCGLVGVDRRTVERWRKWWRETFTASPFWQIGRAAFMPPVDQDRLPASLIERFTGRGRVLSLRCCASSPRSPEATGALDNGLPRSAEDARRRQSEASIYRLRALIQRSAGVIQQARGPRVHERPPYCASP